MHRDYRRGEVDELERRCNKMYTSLVSKAGGIEGVTNYFHYIGSGHVVWMCRLYGNLWRYRNEGVEAFNKIVSLRHNRHNGNGGAKRTREGAATELCPEFWSFGQWLGRWSMWQLGYADGMDPDNCQPDESGTSISASAFSDDDMDKSYSVSSGHTDDGSDESDVFSESDDESDVSIEEFEPITPSHLAMGDCRALNLLHRNCTRRAEN
jgi:hypothetical protein